ncbi:hypothetical protein [Sulfitobacter noctilucicola]|uniref:Uncharacterized protein n=1 Tax=Sulfitobacter noctilucicola TaxID=1342301 RepID=A0A7W6Q4Y8_9RHOB|nr:hypothetical protein [Sulfitobacter noctilucicola]MBB4175820.1 hypothetical protein [Sulfitobacter noctilucicola]
MSIIENGHYHSLSNGVRAGRPDGYVFAIQSGDTLEIVAHTGLAAGFSALAIIGARTSSWLLATALLSHGIFDVVAESMIANPAPRWWGPFCLGIDVVLALALATMLWHRKALD